MSKRVCDAAVEVLRETDNPAVMWGDTHLLHQIADRAGIKSAQRGGLTERRVLAALARQPGILVKRYTQAHVAPQTRTVLVFRLPETITPEPPHGE